MITITTGQIVGTGESIEKHAHARKTMDFLPGVNGPTRIVKCVTCGQVWAGCFTEEAHETRDLKKMTSVFYIKPDFTKVNLL